MVSVSDMFLEIRHTQRCHCTAILLHKFMENHYASSVVQESVENYNVSLILHVLGNLTRWVQVPATGLFFWYYSTQKDLGL